MASNNVKLSTYSANEITWGRVTGKPTFSGGTTTLAWGTTSTIANVGGNEVKITMPANPNTDHYAWNDITGKPATATSWPTWDQVTGKPSTFTPSAHTHDYLPFELVSSLDANSANASTKFWVCAASITNAAFTNHSVLLNVAGLGTPFQLQIPDSSHLYIYKRWYASSAWSAWSKISAGYADSAGSVAWDNVTGKPSTFAPASHTHSYLPLSGGTLTGAVTFANNTMNTMGDDCKIGDQNVAGALCIQGTNGATNIRFIQYNGTAAGTISWDGSKFSITGTVATSISGNSATASKLTNITSSDAASNSAVQRYIWIAYADNATGRPAYDTTFTFQTSTGTIFGGRCLDLRGATSATMSNATTNPRIRFSESGGQAVYLAYTDYDSYRASKGLKVVDADGSDAGNVWLEAQGHIYAAAVHSAVWNDYAECRKSNISDPGRVIVPDDSGMSFETTERLMAGCRVISDTWGMIIGESEEAKTPVAICGRVLAYPYQAIENYHAGDCVCSAPNGTVDIMTRDEIKEWPDRIIGVVNEIPDYEIWTQTEPDGEKRTKQIAVNGRIWIDVR